MKPEYEAELRALTPEQRATVLKGLDGKLGHYKRSGVLSFSYNHCPVCQEVGSTEEEPKCEKCYIPKSCKAPFTEGFDHRPDYSSVYFTVMREFLWSLEEPLHEEALIVGGKFHPIDGRPSKVVTKLSAALGCHVRNGGSGPEDFPSLEGRKLTVWVLDVSNGEEKAYPKKDRGSVLICSKRMREGVTRFDSVSRIFQMHANAVIEIGDWTPLGYEMTLVDALGNEWVKTRNIDELGYAIRKFTKWSQGSKRVGSRQIAPQDALHKPYWLDALALATWDVADKVERERGGRYFGNASTRCMKMFPSHRETGASTAIYVSCRNIDKQWINQHDFVRVGKGADGVLEYGGDRKPSVDTPVQMRLYQELPTVRFMIHGHAFIAGAPTTEHYYPCGDMREVPEILKLKDEKAINLKNHGFLIMATTMDELRERVAKSEFINVVPRVD